MYQRDVKLLMKCILQFRQLKGRIDKVVINTLNGVGMK